MGVDFVDITDINDEGLLFADEDVQKIADKFRKEKVDGIIESTAISEQSMSAQDWQKNLTYNLYCGDL